MMTNQGAEVRKGKKPIRGRIALVKGGYVRQGGAVYRIAELIGFESVLGIDVNTKQAQVLDIERLAPAYSPDHLFEDVDLEDITDLEWQTATARLKAIAPFIARDVAGRAEVAERATELGVNTATIYRWLERYKSRNAITALLPRKTGFPEGRTRLPIFVEEVIEEVIQDYYLTKQRVGAHKAVEEVRIRCHNRGIQLPSASAIRARIARVSEEDLLRKRGEKEKARNKFTPVPGTHPGGAFPLDTVQADHTPLDIIVTDDQRRPIGRPFLTLVVDLYSRMVMGYYLSLDAPSQTSVGLALAHAMLPKARWLLSHDVEADWPVWGIPRVLQVDNGLDFRADSLKKACETNLITLEYCPVRLPNYKGAVERIYRTINQEIHSLPGSTFSNTAERGEYNSVREATLTLGELERWLLKWICETYHVRPHRTLVMSPLSQWTLGTLGDGETPGMGLPEVPADGETLTRDFMAFKKRTIHKYGVEIGGIAYYADVLNTWVALDNPEGSGKLFTFRVDPRDISKIYFYDPKAKVYFDIPFADRTHPAISAYELKRGKELLKAQGVRLRDATEEQLMNATLERRGIVEAASELKTISKKTTLAWRDVQRQKEHTRRADPANPPLPRSARQATQKGTATAPLPAAMLNGDVEPYGEIG